MQSVHIQLIFILHMLKDNANARHIPKSVLAVHFKLWIARVVKLEMCV